jgi:hypothetical protein
LLAGDAADSLRRWGWLVRLSDGHDRLAGDGGARYLSWHLIERPALSYKKGPVKPIRSDSSPPGTFAPARAVEVKGF